MLKKILKRHIGNGVRQAFKAFLWSVSLLNVQDYLEL